MCESVSVMFGCHVMGVEIVVDLRYVDVYVYLMHMCWCSVGVCLVCDVYTQ